jgi:hypothetical protein
MEPAARAGAGVEFSKVSDGGAVLDVGSGTARWLSACARNPRRHFD